MACRCVRRSQAPSDGTSGRTSQTGRVRRFFWTEQPEPADVLLAAHCYHPVGLWSTHPVGRNVPRVPVQVLYTLALIGAVLVLMALGDLAANGLRTPNVILALLGVLLVRPLVRAKDLY